MNTIIMFAAALLPVALLLLYILKKDTRPEPTGRLVKAVLWGAGMCVPAALVEMAISMAVYNGENTTILGTTIDAFFVVALTEEGFKLLALWIALRKNPFFDEHFDPIVYTVCVGLGFAAIENITYIFGEEEWLYIAIGRALLAVPGHYAFAVIMGYYYSLYHFTDHSRRAAVLILLAPVLAHGVYDALALGGTVDPSIAGVCFFILIWFCIKMHKFAREKIVEQVEKDSRNEDRNI